MALVHLAVPEHMLQVILLVMRRGRILVRVAVVEHKLQGIGGAGEYVEALITPPATTYTYTVGGGGGNGGAAGSFAGGNGAAGPHRSHRVFRVNSRAERNCARGRVPPDSGSDLTVCSYNAH